MIRCVKVRLTNSPLRPVSGWGAHHGMFDRRQRHDVAGQLLDAAAPVDDRFAERHVVVVNGGETVDHLAHAGRKGLVGRMEAGPQRIAARRRHDAAVQDRRHRGPGAEGDIRVPGVVVETPGAVLFDDRDLGLFGHDAEHRMRRFDIPEMPGKGQLLGRSDALVPQKDHEVIEQRLADPAAQLRIETPGKVDAADFRPHRRAQRVNLHRRCRHRALPCRTTSSGQLPASPRQGVAGPSCTARREPDNVWIAVDRIEGEWRNGRASWCNARS